MARTPTPAKAGTQNSETPPATVPPESPNVVPEPPVEPSTGDEADRDDDQISIEVRVLSAFGEHAPNSVIALPERVANLLERDGQVDSHPDAVAYAKSLQG